MYTPTQAVQRGAKLLDQYDANWRDRIDVEHLEMNSAERCIIGQLFPYAYAAEDVYAAYEYGLEILGLMGENASHYGFDAYPGRTDRHQYAALRSEWIKLIRPHMHTEGD